MNEYFDRMRAIGPAPAWQVTPRADTHLYEMAKLRASRLSEMAGGPGEATPPGGYPLTFHGQTGQLGCTIPSPKLVLVYLGQWWGDTARLEAFAGDVMVAGYLAPLKDYGSGLGTFLGSVKGPALPGTSVDDATLQATLRQLLLSDLPKADGHTLYALLLPEGMTVSMGGSASCSGFCGYHGSLDNQTFYTVQPATGCQGCNLGDPFNGMTMVLGHEIAEACTDAVVGSGWVNDQTGMENADEWAWLPKPYGPWVVQGYQVNGIGDSYGAYQAPVPAPIPKPAAHWQADQSKPTGEFLAWVLGQYQGEPAPTTAAIQSELDDPPGGGWGAYFRSLKEA